MEFITSSCTHEKSITNYTMAHFSLPVCNYALRTHEHSRSSEILRVPEAVKHLTKFNLRTTSEQEILRKSFEGKRTQKKLDK